MALRVLIVGGTHHRELSATSGRPFGIADAAASIAGLARDLGEHGAEVRTVSGRVTERRVERALRRLGKDARAGHDVAVVMVGHRWQGGLAVDTTVARKPGRRLRVFSKTRIARLLGGMLVGGEAARECVVAGRRIPLLFQAPSPLPPRDKDAWRHLDLSHLARRLQHVLQFDPDTNGIRLHWDGHALLDTKEAEANARVALITTDTTRLSDDFRVIGCLVLVDTPTGRHEIWRFADGAWPEGAFRVELVRMPMQLGALDTLNGWKEVDARLWRGFAATAEPSRSLPSAYRFRVQGDPLFLPPRVYAGTGLVDGARRVTGWWGRTRDDLHFGEDGTLYIRALHGGPVTLVDHYPPAPVAV